MVHLNVRGLLARDASAVAQAVDACSQDVMVFTETWLRRDAEAPEISGFTAVLNLPRSKRMEKRAEEESATRAFSHGAPDWSRKLLCSSAQRWCCGPGRGRVPVRLLHTATGQPSTRP